MIKNYLSNKIETILLLIIIAIALIATIGWIFQIRGLLFVLSDSASMKINTAVLTICLSIALLLRRKKNRNFKIIYFLIISVVLLFSVNALISYMLGGTNAIDTLFLEDVYSQKFPGRMSRATALCFTFLSLGLYGSSIKHAFIRKASHFFFVIVLIIAFISFVSHLLLIPMENKSLFFQTMAIQTSAVFILYSLILLLKRSEFKFGEFVLGNYSGSKIMRIMFPFIILMPILLTYFLILVFNKKLIALDFGIVIGSVVYILISIGYLMLVGDHLNKSDQIRKKLERQLYRSKREALKVNLLQETHHRVKNNFQMVNSILSLQAQKFKDPRLLSALDDCQDRIRAMAVLHESMYQYGNYENVPVQSFFAEIISPLIRSYANGKSIHVELNIEPEFMVMNLAIPTGLIINEMLTNSLKYAFVDKNKGSVNIELLDINNQYYVLHIGDDGIGFNEAMHLKSADSQSMGQELINIFTEQLHGKKTRLDQPGTNYSISFPKYYN